MGEAIVCFQVFTRSLEVIIRNPTHRFPSCDASPLLVFSTVGEDDVCGEPDCVRIYIDGIEVPAIRIGDAYGYDYYGADNRAGWIPESCSYGYGCDDLPDGACGHGHGYGHDDGYGQDGIAGTIDDTYGADRLLGTRHIFQLPTIPDGLHIVRVVVKGTSGLESENTETFIVDTTPPVIKITSPLNDHIHPVTEIPTLLYTIEDFSGVATANVNIDGVDYGWLPSGTVLDFLKSGLHTIIIYATDISTGGCGAGNGGRAIIRFNLLKPIVIDEIPTAFYIGTNASTKDKSADGIIEEFRILNTSSTDNHVLEDFKLLRAKISFQLRKGAAVLTPEEVLLLQQLGISGDRINIPTETLMLCHYDTNIDSLPGIDNRNDNGEGIDLSNPDNQIIDPAVAGRRIDVTAYYYENSVIDRELITELIKRIAPAFAEVGVVFERVQAQ